MMKLQKVLNIISAVVLIAGAWSCGQQGDAGQPGANNTDYVEISADGAAPVRYTETADPGTHFGADPYVASIFDSSNGQMYLYVLADYASGAYSRRIDILINGSQPGAYAIAGGSHLFYFSPGGSFSADTAYPQSNGTITVARFEGPGGFVEGAFDVTAVGSDNAATVHLTGNFKVRRE